MIEKVNPSHPDKIADRIAGALVDMAYRINPRPRIAVEVLIGHGRCHIIAESSVQLPTNGVYAAVHRIADAPAGSIAVDYVEVPQDPRLAKNQDEHIRCGDNGIFKGMPLTQEQKTLACIARKIYRRYPTDGKYILDGDHLIICQSMAPYGALEERYPHATINPLGGWIGGIDVDAGATNRKLGSDMGDAVTGGGLHGKDLSKADVSVNIYAHLLAQQRKTPVELCCAIGDTEIGGTSYDDIARTAHRYIRQLGGFEKLAEWGLF